MKITNFFRQYSRRALGMYYYIDRHNKNCKYVICTVTVDCNFLEFRSYMYFIWINACYWLFQKVCETSSLFFIFSYPMLNDILIKIDELRSSYSTHESNILLNDTRIYRVGQNKPNWTWKKIFNVATCNNNNISYGAVNDAWRWPGYSSLRTTRLPE